MTQGIYLLAKLGFPLRLLNVQRYFSSHESQHFPAGKDLEDNLREPSHQIQKHRPRKASLPQVTEPVRDKTELQLMSSG